PRGDGGVDQSRARARGIAARRRVLGRAVAEQPGLVLLRARRPPAGARGVRASARGAQAGSGQSTGDRVGAGGDRRDPPGAGGLARGRLVTLGAVVRERFPGRHRPDVDVRADLGVDRVLDCRHADARAFAVRPAAAEEVRPAGAAERLCAPAFRDEALKQLLARDDVDRGRWNAEVYRPGAAGELLAARAVADAERVRLRLDLELDLAA